MRILRVVVAVIVLGAIGFQFFVNAGSATFDAVNFFSFFTIVCNIFGAVVFLLAGAGLPSGEHGRDVLRGAATLCLVVVGIVYSALLAGGESLVLPWVNVIVHYAVPLFVMFDWFIDPPRTHLTPRDMTRWLVIPLAYVAYTLARGAIVHWYPYPFLDADVIGYPNVITYVAGITIFTLLIAWVLSAGGNALRARRA